MPKFTSEAKRREFYYNRYGEEEGAKKYAEALERDGRISPDGPLDTPQPSILGSIPERTPRRPQPTINPKNPSKKEVTAAVGAGLAIANKGVQFVWPPWKEDELNPLEIGLLADALADEILSSKTLTRLLVKAKENSVHVKLAYVLAIIAIPRLEKRGLLPDFFGTQELSGEGEGVNPMEAATAEALKDFPLPDIIPQPMFVPVNPVA
jgi:hypothetical protein